jgi:hypothetical protein
MTDRQTYHNRYVSPDGNIITEIFSETVTDEHGTTSSRSSHQSVRVQSSSRSAASDTHASTAATHASASVRVSRKSTST